MEASNRYGAQRMQPSCLVCPTHHDKAAQASPAVSAGGSHQTKAHGLLFLSLIEG